MGIKVSLLNRKELFISYEMKKQADIRNLLTANGIDYQVKVVNRKNPSPLGGNDRARTGTFGENLEAEYQYIIYVAKEDYEKAKHLSNQANRI